MDNAKRDENFVPTLLGVSNVDGATPVPIYADPITHRLLVDLPGGSGSVTSVSVVSANGFAGTVATPTSTPAITLSTTVTGILYGNGTSVAALTIGSGLTLVGSTLSATGGGGSPGGSNGQVQYNNAGSFGGITGLTTNGTYVTLTEPRFADLGFIADQNGNEMLAFNSVASAVNYLEIENAATGNPPHIRSRGNDTNIGLHLVGKGTGEVSVCDATDETKRMRFNLSNNTTNVITTLRSNSTVARTIDLPDASGTLLFNGGPLGTPSSGTVTNLTGTASININGTVGATTPAAGTFTTVIGNSFVPNSSIVPSNGMYLPVSSTLGWSVGGVAEMLMSSLVLQPATNDGLALGNGTAAWADLFLASGGVINFNNGNYTLTHSAGLLTANGAFSIGTANALTAGTIELGAATDTTISRSAAGVIAVEGVVIPSISSTNTLTNKRITPRVGSATSSATPTINTDNVDFYELTAQAVDITSFTTNLSGTPTNGQMLRIAITGTAARAITWGTSFEASTVALPTTTVSTNRLDVGFVWNAATSRWRCIAVA